MADARKATLKDIPELKGLYLELMLRFEKMDSFDAQDRSYWKTKAEAYLRKMIKGKRDMFIVLEEDSSLIGFAHLTLIKRDPTFKIKEEGHIEAMFIVPEHRKKGYGKLLFNESIRLLKKKGMKHFTVSTHAKDWRANSFWKRMGFKEYNIKYRK